MDFGHLNARIRAWRSRLLNKETYDGLIAADTLEGMMDRLKATPYARDIEVASSRLGGGRESEVLEVGFKGNLQGILKGLWRYAPSGAEAFLKAILSWWEVYNIKTVLRGGNKGVPPEEVFALLLPCGHLDEMALKELTIARDVRGVAHLLDTWGSPYAKPLREGLQRYIKDKDLMPLEVAIDRFLYEYHLKVLEGNGVDARIVRALIQDRIDLTNISMLLKLAGEKGIPPTSYFIHGGIRLTEDDFLLYARGEGKDDLLRGLAERLKDETWRRVANSIDPEEAFLLEERLEGLIQERFWRRAIVEPLSIAMCISYIYEKTREIKNLRLISKGKVYKIPGYEIKRLMKGMEHGA